MRISDWSSDVCSSDLRVQDLWWHLPAGLIDRRYRPSIAEAEPGRIATITLTIDRHQPPRTPRLPYRITAHDGSGELRSEEHTSELQSLMRISYAVFCLKKKTKNNTTPCATTTYIANYYHTNEENNNNI